MITATLRLAAALVLMALWLAAPAWAEEPPRCKVGAWIGQIYGLDPKADGFSADFWLWSRCPAEAEGLSPLASLDFPEALRLSPGPISKEAGDGWLYERRRVSGVFRHEWAMRDFPFDDHRLEILIVDDAHDRDALILEADAESSGVDDAAPPSGWAASGFMLKAEGVAIEEAPGAKAPKVSQLTLSVTIERQSWAAFFKFLVGLDVVVLVCLLGLFFDVNNPGLFGSRMSLLMAGLLAVLVNMRGVDAALGDTPELTRIAQLHLAGMAAILAVAVLTVLDRRRADAGQPAPHPRTGAALALLGLFGAAHLGLIGAAAGWL